MKRLSLYLFLILFTLQTPSQADDISDFEIEGMSIGDSLLDFMSKSYIDGDTIFLYKNKKYATIFSNRKKEIYDDVQISFLANDSKYLISDMEGKLYFPNDIKGCLNKKKTIVKEISDFLGDEVKKGKKNKNHRADKTGKSKVFINSFWFEDGSTLQVYCTDWSEKMGHKDELKVVVATKEVLDWVIYEAYK
jgi:hypothetical protein